MIRMCLIGAKERQLTATLAIPSAPNIVSHPRIIPQGVTVSCTLCILDWANFARTFFDLVAEGSCGTFSELGLSAVTQPFRLMVNCSSSLSNMVCCKRDHEFDSGAVRWIMA